MKVILLAGKDIGVLTLRELLRRKEVSEVVAAVPGDEEFLNFAKSSGVKVLIPEDINSEPFLTQVRDLGAELLVNVFFLRRYRASLLQVSRFGAINVHPSKLPYYRGRDCIRWAMVNGELEIGITVHQMDEALDTGDILIQKLLPVGIDENYLEIRERIKESYPGVVLEAIEKMEGGKLERRKQDTRIDGTYLPHRTLEDGRINWSDNSLDIHNLVRASFEPGFYAYSFLKGKKIYISKARLKPGNEYSKLSHGSSQRRAESTGLLLGG